MNNENDIRSMTAEQLRAGINAVLNPAPPVVGPSLPAGVNSALLTPDQQQVASDLWIAAIMDRKPQTWTPEEREAVRAETARVLREMGH